MAKQWLGYQNLIDTLSLRVRPPQRKAVLSSSVNRKNVTATEILFPKGVGIEDTPLGHLEFALRHEDLNLEVVAATFKKLPPESLLTRYDAAPNGEFIRKACFLWEWLGKGPLPVSAKTTGPYLPMLDPDQHAVAGNPGRNAKYRIIDNLLGGPAFCPLISRAAMDWASDLPALLASVMVRFKEIVDPDLYKRAVQYMYLSETKGSFGIERETANAGKEERFVRLLQRAGENEVTEEWLVELQNAVVRDDFSKEASFRFKQNWLEDSNGRLTFMPPSPEDLPRLIEGWLSFTNDTRRDIPLMAKLAGAAFGFVYLHPFMDGNGRLHRFLIHHLLAHSGLLKKTMIVPVSAVILREMMPEYGQVLTGFSRPVTRLWDYVRTDDGPVVRTCPGPSPYAYFNADAETAFLANAMRKTINEEIPKEIAFLVGFDEARRRLNLEFDLPDSDVNALVRMIHGNRGTLSAGKRKRFARLPAEVVEKIEAIVRNSFGRP